MAATGLATALPAGRAASETMPANLSKASVGIPIWPEFAPNMCCTYRPSFSCGGGRRAQRSGSRHVGSGSSLNKAGQGRAGSSSRGRNEEE
eukprot:scaffold10544_cov105-Isochrysis_galbana.AAC.9